MSAQPDVAFSPAVIDVEGARSVEQAMAREVVRRVLDLGKDETFEPEHYATALDGGASQDVRYSRRHDLAPRIAAFALALESLIAKGRSGKWYDSLGQFGEWLGRVIASEEVSLEGYPLDRVDRFTVATYMTGKYGTPQIIDKAANMAGMDSLRFYGLPSGDFELWIDGDTGTVRVRDGDAQDRQIWPPVPAEAEA